MGAPKRTVAPVLTPVTLQEAKDELDILDDNSQDGLILDKILAATQMVESLTRRALMTQTWTLTFDHFPCGDIELRRCPVQSVTHIKYYASDVLTTYTAADYETDLTSEPARIRPVDGTVWPTVDTQVNGVVVTFVAGWTADTAKTSEVFRLAKMAVLMATTSLYHGCGQMGMGFDALIQMLRWEGGV